MNQGTADLIVRRKEKYDKIREKGGGKENLAVPCLRLSKAGKLAAVVHGNGLDDLRKVLAILRSCTNSRSIQIREPKLPMAR